MTADPYSLFEMYMVLPFAGLPFYLALPVACILLGSMKGRSARWRAAWLAFAAVLVFPYFTAWYFEDVVRHFRL